MSKRMVKNAWERSYRCNKVFKAICFCFGGDVEVYQGWFGSIGSIFLAAAARIFRCYACVCFFTACQQKRGSVGAYSCFTNQPPWIIDRSRVGAWMYPDDFPKTRWKSHWKCCSFTHFSFCVAGLQQMPPQCIPHYYQAGQATERIRSPQRFTWTFPRISASRLFKYVWSIQRQNVRNNSINGLTGVFLDRHGWFDRPLWQSLRCLRLTYIVTGIVCIQYFH